ncbi:hypothetical protein MOO45_03955 [Bombilactobacillus folatiphilus]|uniref:Uncharacterized protein n=1 Tax=Bombilactobacillus folatiphilus TaxID=2923362 RepID=A0ABY4PAN0_9LACO|nr:hypothetical protein [Bombilactobacillus folatiphilus]UQS82805.1 hypothetical protein MOO45_03955 [Bombilactobacillus folatiphilus]
MLFWKEDNAMLTFGKRASYRPLLTSILTGLIFSLIIGDILGLTFGIVTFVVVMVLCLLWYVHRLPHIYGYLHMGHDQINYYDMRNFWSRLYLLFWPFAQTTQLTFDQIAAVTLNGDLVSEPEFDTLIPTTARYGWWYSTIQMGKHPMSLKLKLIDGREIAIDLSRDYVYNPVQFKDRVQQFSLKLVH